MASRLTPKEERVLSQVNQDKKERDINLVGQTEQTLSEHFHQTGGVHKEDAQPGVIGSLIKTVQGTIGQAKDAVMGKSTESADDYTTTRAGDAAAKAREKIDAGYAVEKGSETADYTAEKAKAADTIAGKMGEYKDTAAKKAKTAHDTTDGKQKIGETTVAAQEKYEETEEDDIKGKLTPQLAVKMDEQGPCGGNGEAQAENRLTADEEYMLLFGSILVLGS